MESLYLQNFQSGKTVQQQEYQSFLPDTICKEWICTDPDIERIEFEILPSLGRSQQKAQILINSMYKQPIADGHKIAEIVGLHPSNANNLIQKLSNQKIITELTGYQRNRIFTFTPYIKIFTDS